mmetsp:Transcript_25886/g.86322  ORF Transcript_25886/g.86322 Transcript_25886/m.86322 type:complete len:293 (+) Transcript_25886:24-902(+)
MPRSRPGPEECSGTARCLTVISKYSPSINKRDSCLCSRRPGTSQPQQRKSPPQEPLLLPTINHPWTTNNQSSAGTAARSSRSLLPSSCCCPSLCCCPSAAELKPPQAGRAEATEESPCCAAKAATRAPSGGSEQAPRVVTQRAPVRQPYRAASARSAPETKQASRPALKASPAPTASRATTGGAETALVSTARPPTSAPSRPRVMTTLPPTCRDSRARAASTSPAGTPATAHASSSFGVKRSSSGKRTSHKPSTAPHCPLASLLVSRLVVAPTSRAASSSRGRVFRSAAQEK